MSVIDDGRTLDQQIAYKDGGLVLDEWNGRPTELLMREEEQWFLRWLVIGQNESVDVWLHLELRPGEPEELLIPGPHDLWTFVGDHKESRVEISLEIGGVEQVRSWFECPGGEDAVPKLLAWFTKTLAGAIDEEAVPADVDELHHAIDEIQSFLS